MGESYRIGEYAGECTGEGVSHCMIGGEPFRFSFKFSFRFSLGVNEMEVLLLRGGVLQ
jgi:hypothetical protein